jgi:hypothetical protein
MNSKRNVMVLACVALALAGCASGAPPERRLSDDSQRYFDENPSAFDSDVYYDPFYGYRGTGEFRAQRKLKPY